MTKQEEKLANQLVIEMMRNNPVKMVRWMLVALSRELVEARAATMSIKQESDVGKKRYRVECEVKIIPVRSKINKSKKDTQTGIGDEGFSVQ